MRRVAARVLVLTSNLVALAAPPAAGCGDDEAKTPAERYEALRREHVRAASSGVPLTDAERLAFVGRVYRHRNALALRFLALAEEHSDDPIALDALIEAVWQVNTTPWPVELVGEDTARARAFELIGRDHIGSDRLGPLCERIAHGFCKEYETLLRGVLAKNPHRSVQATASLALAHFLDNRSQRIDLCREQPLLAKEFAGLYGDEYSTELRRQPREKVIEEVEALLERVAATYGDVTLAGGVTAAERARTELFAMRNLRVGKAAPDIEGEDQYGKRFRLSDYRGKAVLLDFWSWV